MSKSLYEIILARECEDAGLPAPVLQFKAIPGRNFTWDMAWPEYHLLVEVQGGIWARKSGHNTGYGITRDAVKTAWACAAGYRSLLIPTKWIDENVAVKVIRAGLHASLILMSDIKPERLLPPRAKKTKEIDYGEENG
jgi:hypothetical protein